ncbi:MAG: hypothetical protein V8R27_00005 [Oscillospiraceae bacterium]
MSRNRVDTARFPASTWAKLTRQVLSEAPEALLSPVPHQGLPALRQAIADELRDLGMAVSPSQIIRRRRRVSLPAAGPAFGPGYSLCRGRPRLPQNPSGLSGLRRCLCPHSAGRTGHRPGGAGRLRRRGPAHFPNHQYPTGLVTPIARRQALLRWRTPGGTIIEDDYDSEFRFTGRPIPTLQSIDARGRVVYLNTFSKPFLPPCASAFWCCRPGFWSATAGI